jgi:hypothetical protein
MSKRQVSATTPIRTWYITAYPTDDVGPTLNPTTTFADLWQAIKDGVCVYATLGGDADSVVRERVFAQLAALLGTDYDRIYTLWTL